MNYTTINIIVDLKCNEKQQNHNAQADSGVWHNVAYVSGPFLCEGGFFISVQKIISTSLQCRIASILIWSCSP
jgi:hypothetical protein